MLFLHKVLYNYAIFTYKFYIIMLFLHKVLYNYDNLDKNII